MSLDVTLASPGRGVEVELAISTGETLALLGPNGAGKSTILDAVAGLLRPTTGTVRVDERVLTDVRAGTVHRFVRPHRRKIGLLAQDPLLFPHLSALENVAFGPRSGGANRRSARDDARAWLSRVHAGDLEARRPSQLSGGQAQRVALARALATDPDVVLLDEPMSALDAQVAPALRRTLRESLSARTTLLVTHDLVDALLLADRVAVLEEGRVVEQGATVEVLTHPRSTFAAHLADLNLAEGRWRDGAVHLADGQSVQGLLSGEDPVEGGSAIAVFRPAAVSIFLEAPHGSPRNHLRAVVTEVHPHAGLVRVRAGALSADITPTAAAALALVPGDSVIFSVKATEVTVYGR
jgi:molybdate transport system ATP-binding protein